MNQIEVLANKIISSSESVFFAGTPSQTTITIYLPRNIQNIEFQDTELIITASSSTGNIKRAFTSKVPFDPTSSVTLGEGSRELTIKAYDDYVNIS